MKQSFDLSGSFLKQMQQFAGKSTIPGPEFVGSVPGGVSNGIDGGTNLLSSIIQLNQLTLSSLELLRNWEKLTEHLKAFTGGFPGWSDTKTDDHNQEHEEKIATLKTRLDEQEALIKELQVKLKTTEGTDSENAESGHTGDVLSKFFTEHNQQFQRLLKNNVFQP
ncbi:MAG: hypothetical protein HQ517_06840 [SAR324 cluster bacterium]|nr:hypothetical protein [SAR324 cluster bacterium]